MVSGQSQEGLFGVVSQILSCTLLRGAVDVRLSGVFAFLCCPLYALKLCYSCGFSKKRRTV